MTSRSNSGASCRTALTTDSIDASSLYAGMATSKRFGTIVIYAEATLETTRGALVEHTIRIAWSWPSIQMRAWRRPAAAISTESEQAAAHGPPTTTGIEVLTGTDLGYSGTL